MPQKSGLGRGLGALIPGGENALSENGVVLVSVDAIAPNPRQPRTSLHPEELADLTASVREHGVLQPLIVTLGMDGGGYILIAGERRLEAARLAGLATVPVLVRQATDQQRLELAIIENVQRADLSPLEEAEAYRQLAEDFNLSHEAIAARVGKSRVAVTNTLRLLKLPDPVIELHCASAKFVCQRRGPLVGTIRHEDAARTARKQGARGFFARIPRANDHDIVVLKRAEDFFGQLDRHGSHRYAAALDVGFGADVFGDIESALKRFVKPLPGMAVLKGQGVSLL